MDIATILGPRRDEQKQFRQNDSTPVSRDNKPRPRKDPIRSILDSLSASTPTKEDADSAFTPVVQGSIPCEPVSPQSGQLPPCAPQYQPLNFYNRTFGFPVAASTKLPVTHFSDLHAYSGLPFRYSQESIYFQNISRLYHQQMYFEKQNIKHEHPHNVSGGYAGTGSSPIKSESQWLSWMNSHYFLNNQQYLTSDMHVKDEHKSHQRAPVTPTLYYCEDCKKSYSTYGGLTKHKQFHCVNQVKKEFSCKYCGKCYGSLGALKMHIRTHTLPCKCKLCGKAFSRPWLLQGHVRTHTGEKPFRCDHCGRAFADRSNLRAHLQTHTEVKKYACQICNKTFSRMSLLTKHRENNSCGMKR